MKIRLLLLCGSLLLSSISAMATIVDGVRQKPTYTTMGFSSYTLGEEVYLYNVEAQAFFSQGNSWATQASVDNEGRKVRFSHAGSSDYIFEDYCWRTEEQQGGYMEAGWREVFFDSETAMFVDRNGQNNYFFAVEDNGATFRLAPAAENPNYGDYAGAGLYVGWMKNANTTALSPFVDDEEAYVDWALVTVADHDAMAGEMAIYNKAQELKVWIDKIKALNGSASSLESVYLDESSTMDELQAAIDSAFPIYLQAVVDNAPDKDNVDLTMALVNPMLEEGTTGWTNGSTVTVAGLPTNKCMEAFNKASFDVYQELADMPVGVYEIEVQGFYRYKRDQAAWEAYKAQSVDYVKPEGVPVYVYLNNNSTPFKNIYSEPVTKGTLYTTDGSLLYPGNLPPCEDDLGNWYPNEMYNSAMAFDAGMYKQTAYGLIANEGDDFRIGVKGSSNQAGDSWVIWDNFKLYYRGFKPEVVQPILETAMADLNQYAGLLMGKTEFAALNQALTDAQTAIDEQNGEKMFKALNDLYDVKESVIASKDLFLNQEVPTDLANLQNVITEQENAKMSVATREAATTLAQAIQSNSRYEGTQIEQLKSDVLNAINNLYSSAGLYSNLATAISTLEAAVALKANQALLDEAATLIESAQAGYNDGSIADNEVNAKISALNSKAETVNSSATAYGQLATAITNLADAIAVASTDEARVAKSTLTKANLRLNNSQTLYDNGTIADADIAERVSTIGQLIDELTHSINLYKEFKQALDDLGAALAGTAPMSSATRSAAQGVYDTALEAYDEGSVDDDKIEAQKNALNAQITAINTSVALYGQLNTAITALEGTLDQYANALASATVRSNANTLLTDTKAAYGEGSIADGDVATRITQLGEAGTALTNSVGKYADLAEAFESLQPVVGKKALQTLMDEVNRLDAKQADFVTGAIADEDIDGIISDIEAIIPQVNASATAYASLAAAITNLADAIAVASTDEARVAKSTLTKANLRLNNSQTLYDNGTIADADIAERVSTIGQLIDELTHSINLYKEFKQALDDLGAALAGTAPMSSATRSAAQGVYDTALEAYDEGSVDDDKIEAQKNDLNAQITAINTSVALYGQLNTAITALEGTLDQYANALASATVRSNANTLLTDTKAAYGEGSIADGDVVTRITQLGEAGTALTNSVGKYADLAEAFESLQPVVGKKALQTLMDEVDRLDAKQADFVTGAIADEDIDGIISDIEAIIPQVNASAEKYADLATAITNLEEAIEAASEEGVRVAKSTLTKAGLRLTASQEVYDEGTIADADIAERVLAINQLITDLTTSINLYNDFKQALDDLSTALAGTDPMSAAIRSAAQGVYDTALEAYNEGSVNDDQIEAQKNALNAQVAAINASIGQYAQFSTALNNFQTAITAAQEAGASVSMITNANNLKAGYQSGYDNGSEENVPAALTAISNAIANLGAAAPLYAQADDLTTDFANLATELGKADGAIALAEDVLEQYLSPELRTGLETALDDLKDAVADAKTDKTTMENNLAGYQLDLTNSESTLGEDHADLYADMGTAFNTMSGNIDNLINSLNQLRTNLEGVTENAVEKSANKVEIAHNIATFCSMIDLDFTDEEKVRAYIVSAFTPSNGEAILTRVYDVPAGTGVVLIGDNGNYEIPAGNGTTVVSNLLVGVNRSTVLNQVDGTNTNFILTDGENGLGFYPVQDGSTLAAGKAYLPLPTASLPASGIASGAAIRFVFEDSREATFIEGVGFYNGGSKMEKGVYYNLNGQRVGRPVTGGIYILDGKKVYVK